MPEDMSEYMPEDLPDRMPEDMSEYMPEDMPDRMPEDMSDRVPEDMPDRMPEDLPDRMPEDMPEDMPDHMPEDMPDRMSNRMSEDMSDRMPEDLPVRKCINVMVGITRSKVIIPFVSWKWHFKHLETGLNWLNIEVPILAFQLGFFGFFGTKIPGWNAPSPWISPTRLECPLRALAVAVVQCVLSIWNLTTN